MEVPVGVQVVSESWWTLRWVACAAGGHGVTMLVDAMMCVYEVCACLLGIPVCLGPCRHDEVEQLQCLGLGSVTASEWQGHT